MNVGWNKYKNYRQIHPDLIELLFSRTEHMGSGILSLRGIVGLFKT